MEIHTDLAQVVAALAKLSDTSLRALMTTANDVPQVVAPGFLAWLAFIADWEQHRRTGIELPLLPPDSAIPPEEDVVSIATATVLSRQFARDVPSVAALFEAIVGVLTGASTRH